MEYIKTLTFGQIILHVLGAAAVNCFSLAMLWMLP